MCIAVPMKVVELLPSDRAMVEADGVSMEVSLSLVGEVNIGDYVIVHTGFVLEILDIEEAEKTLSVLNEIVTAEMQYFTGYNHESAQKAAGTGTHPGPDPTTKST